MFRTSRVACVAFSISLTLTGFFLPANDITAQTTFKIPSKRKKLDGKTANRKKWNSELIYFGFSTFCEIVNICKNDFWF